MENKFNCKFSLASLSSCMLCFPTSSSHMQREIVFQFLLFSHAFFHFCGTLTAFSPVNYLFIKSFDDTDRFSSITFNDLKICHTYTLILFSLSFLTIDYPIEMIGWIWMYASLLFQPTLFNNFGISNDPWESFKKKTTHENIDIFLILFVVIITPFLSRQYVSCLILLSDSIFWYYF